jgi:hypothetical protein
MKAKKLLQVFTLLLFVFFLSSFIAYKTGKLNGYFTPNDNISSQTIRAELQKTPNQPVVDSPTHSPAVKKDTSVRYSPAMMSTSKSAVVIDQKMQFDVKDTPKYLKNNVVKDTIVHLPKH